MGKKKSILLVGAGRFGRHMAMKLQELGHEVWAVDQSEERVNDLLPYVTNAQIGDTCSEAFIGSLGVRDFDVCVVTIGDEFQSSLETTALLKECGAKFVVARASREVHAKFLLRNGADEVVYPEKEMAIRAAVRYSSDNVFDYIRLNDEYSIYETSVPEGWIGRSIVELGVRQKHHINILAIKRDDALEPLPRPDYMFRQGDRILILGANRDIRKFIDF